MVKIVKRSAKYFDTEGLYISSLLVCRPVKQRDNVGRVGSLVKFAFSLPNSRANVLRSDTLSTRQMASIVSLSLFTARYSSYLRSILR